MRGDPLTSICIFYFALRREWTKTPVSPLCNAYMLSSARIFMCGANCRDGSFGSRWLFSVPHHTCMYVVFVHYVLYILYKPVSVSLMHVFTAHLHFTFFFFFIKTNASFVYALPYNNNIHKYVNSYLVYVLYYRPYSYGWRDFSVCFRFDVYLFKLMRILDAQKT